MIVCPHSNGHFAVRPITWAGIWDKNGLLSGGKSIAYFEDKQDAEDYVAYSTSGLTSDELAEAAALLTAKKEGRCVMLPCRPSDVTVYQMRSKKHALGIGISQRMVNCATVWGNGDYALHHQGADDCLKKDLGKTWFLTPAEAEEAMVCQECRAGGAEKVCEDKRTGYVCPKATQTREAEAAEGCRWEEVEPSIYQTECGMIVTTSIAPAEQGWTHCMRCGRPLK